MVCLCRIPREMWYVLHVLFILCCSIKKALILTKSINESFETNVWVELNGQIFLLLTFGEEAKKCCI